MVYYVIVRGTDAVAIINELLAETRSYATHMTYRFFFFLLPTPEAEPTGPDAGVAGGQRIGPNLKL